jgi:hypothetical protein
MVIQARLGFFKLPLAALSVGLALLALPTVGHTADLAAAEDETNPVVVKQNVIAMAERAISIGTALGFPQETLTQLVQLRQQLDYVSDQEFAEAAAQLGPQAALARRTLERIQVISGLGEQGAEAGAGLYGQQIGTDLAPGHFAPKSVLGHWAYDPAGVRIARTPNFDFNVDKGISGSGNASGKVCSNDPTMSCTKDDDCGQGNTCIDRPSNSQGSGQLSLSSNCAGQAPDDETVRDLLIQSTVFEGVAMVFNRVCDQEILGFNISLACIVTDLAFLVNRSLYDFESLCSDRWASAKADAVYDRTGALHDDLLDTQDAVASFRNVTNDQFSSLNSSIDSHFSSTDASITALGNQVATGFTAVGSQLTAVDDHLTLIDAHIEAQFVALDTHLTSLIGQLSNQGANGTALLNADARQVMKLLLTPDGRRRIVPAILTCKGTDCPDVLANCPAAGCSWNQVGPLP